MRIHSHNPPGYTRVTVVQCACSAPFAIISFPFLFSLMFGDAGHGILMFVAALWMVVLEKKFIQMKSDNEVSSHTHPAAVFIATPCIPPAPTWVQV